jgi:hypothetical protein
MKLTSLFLFAILCSTTAFSQAADLSDAFVVRQEARTFPSGYTTLPRTFVVSRPAEGTYLQGRLFVKTRTKHGPVDRTRFIPGSSVNDILRDLSATAVSSVFLRPGKANVQEDTQAADVAGLDRLYEVSFDATIAPFDACKLLMQSPDVEYATPVYAHQLFFTPNDPLYIDQVWMQNLQMDAAWDITKGSPDVLIAIIDSGTDWQHEDLKDKIWSNPGEIPNNGIDDDNNGFIDDVRGWDFVGNISTTQAVAGQFVPDNDPRVNWGTINGQNGHGTITAGCAAAHTHNGKGVAGTGYHCKIIPIKCGIDNANGQGIFQGYPAIKYAADLGADIINCSWGGTGEVPGAQDIIDYATARGSLVVAASGNNSTNNDITPHNPASLNGVMSVGAVLNNDRPANFTHYGWGTHTYAAGSNVLSTFHGDKYQRATGTSFSCPLVAGICALVKTLHSDWTPEMIREQVRSTSDALPGVSQTDRGNYYGRANAYRALTENASFTSGPQTPGIVLRSVSVSGGTAITTYDPTVVELTFQNILGSATNTTLSYKYTVSNVSVTPGPDVVLGAIAHNAEKKLSLTVDLDENFPWYATDLELELVITSGQYQNFIRAKIPIKLPSANLHTTIVPTSGLTYTLVDASSDRTVYGASTYLSLPIIVRGFVGGSAGLAQTPFLAKAMHALSSTRIVIGGDLSGVAYMAASANGGQQWASRSVANIFLSVADIHMYNDAEGIAVGTGSGSKFGIARTTDGGASWTALSNAPPQNVNEEVIVGAAHFTDEGIWFATSEGRIIYSTNKGQSWAGGRLNVTGARIFSIAFRDNQNGILLYRTSASQSAPVLAASSTSSGQGWLINPFDPANLGITPIAVSSPGKHHIIVGSNGQVFGSDNNGVNWQPILSRPNGPVQVIDCHQFEQPYLALGGGGLGLLAYRYSGPNGTKILEATETLLNYDTIEVNKSRQRWLQLSSKGDADVIITSVVLEHLGTTPDSSFRITVPLDQVIPSGTSDNLGIRCYGTTAGVYTGKVTITSNATQPKIVADLRAVVVEPTSVQEGDAAAEIRLSPNPTATTVSIMVPRSASLMIVDNQGRQVLSMTLPAGESAVDVSSLPSGSYTVVVTEDRLISTLPLSILR